MASKFAITAELNLQTKNLSQVVNNLKRQFQGIDLNIKIKDLASAESQVRGIGTAADGARKSIGLLGNSINEGVKKFAIVTIATGTFVGLTRAVKNAVGSAIEFEREMVKIAQATGKTVSQLRGLELEVGNIATGLGASSKELINAARTLTQAGFAADKVTGSLKILAQTDLAATFKSIEDTTEGAIAILNQFGREAQNTGNEVAFLERSLSAINQVSKDFAVESSDLITAVKTTGSAFESAGGSLNELIALFTSVRSTTRESAESIATGFRTIFTRVQRVDTMNNLRDLGIELQDIKGQFVGPMEAAKRLSIALSSIDPKDFRFNLIVEQLGGFRQVSKVIPLIQQITVAQKAYAVAQNSSGSLAKDAATAQQALSVQIQKTREEFLRFVKDLTQSTSFQSTVSSLLQMANAFIKVADTLKPLIPLIASFAALKIGTALLPTLGLVGGGARQKKSQGGPIGFASGGMVPGSGNSDTVPAMLTPGEFVIRKSSVKKLGAENLARANKYGVGGQIPANKPESINTWLGQTTTRKDKTINETTVKKGTKVDREGYGDINIANWVDVDKDKFFGNVSKREALKVKGEEQSYEDIRKKAISITEGVGQFANKNFAAALTNNQKDKIAATVENIKKYIGEQEYKELKINNVDITASSFTNKDGKPDLDQSGNFKALNTSGGGGILNYIQGKIGEKIYESNHNDKDIKKLDDRYGLDYSHKGNFAEVKVIKEKISDNILYAKALKNKIEEKIDSQKQANEKVVGYKNGDQDIIDVGNVTYARASQEEQQQQAKKAAKASGGLIQKFALGGPAGKSRAANAITIPKIDTYTFDKPAGADLAGTNSKKQQYKLNAEDRLDYDLNTVNVDVDKLKVSKGLLESYRTGDEQNRGFRFEDILLETGMAKSVSMLSNARLDGITKNGDPFEAKSRKSAISAGELEDKLYGAIVDNISEPEKLARARFNANNLTENEDHIKIGGVTVFEDVTRGLGAAVNTKARMGYAEEEAAKQAKEQNKMASVNAQEKLQDLVKNNFGSGFIIQGKQYSPVTKSDKVHPDVPMNLNQLLGGKYQDTLGLNGGPAKVLELLKTFIVRNPVQKKASGGPIADLAWLASGGAASGTDTVPAMLTPGEYVINKKSAQAIGYGALNRMNKVGKFADGGPVGVQRFAAGGDVVARTVQTARLNKFLSGSGKSALSTVDPKEALKVIDILRKIAESGRDIPKALKYVEEQIKEKGANFKLDYKGLSQAVKAKAPQKALEPTATENAGKLKTELDDIVNKGSALSNGLVILASTVAGVVSQMSGLDKELADTITAVTGTFSVINGIGQNLKNMGFAQVAEIISTKKHEMAVKADEAALQKHASVASQQSPGTPGAGGEKTRFGKGFATLFKGAEGGIVGFAAASAAYAGIIANTKAKAEKSGEALSKAMEKFAASANNEAEVRSGMIKTLMLSEKAQSDYRASTSKEAIGGSVVGTVAGSAIGSIFGPIGAMIGGAAGSAIGMVIGTEFAKDFDGAKVAAAAKGISGAFTTASKGILDTNKYFEKIEGKDLNNVNQQFSKMNTELAKAQAELSSFDPSILTTGSEEMKAQFNKAADTVRNFENSIGRLAGIQLQKLTMLMSDMAKLGQNFDIGPAIKAQQDQITKVLNAKYNPDIARATKAGKGELAKGLTNQRDQEIAQGTRQFEKSLLEVKLQILETEKGLIKERAARDAVIGTLVQEKALKTTLQNFKFAVQQAGKSVDQLDAAFSNSVSGLKSAIPSGDVFDLEMPDAADLEPALAALRTIGPIGEKLATNLTDLNTVIPNLETGLESLAKAQATGGASTDIDKLVRDTVEKGFGVSVGSAVGKRLSEIIKDRMTGKGGSVENANPSILSANTREAITKEFTDYAQAIKSMSKETLQVWAAAEEEQRKILDKINESENRKLELTNQGVDSYGRMVEAVSKAYGKNVPLAVKNMQRFAKQFNSIGKTAYSSIQDIGKNLKQAKGQLAQGVKDPLEAGKLQSTANRLEQSLKTLANQSDRTGDTLAELEKFKAQREAITSAGTSYAFGSDEQRKSKDDATVALQQVMAAGGDLDAVSSDMRGQIDSLLGELGDAGKNIKKQLTANFFAKRGNTDMANMVMSESSGPEQKLIAELQTIYQEEIAAQKELKDLEIMHGQGMITGLAQVTNQIAGFNDQLKARVQKGEKGAQDIQKAAGVTDSKMTVKEIDEIINSTKTSLTKVEENIATFAKYLGELNEYLAFVKDPEAFKKTGAPIPAKPGAVPVAKAKGGIIYKADGGFTPRGTDTVPAMLTPGEFVIQKSAVDSIGVSNLEAMNNGYADGGLVSYFRRGGRAMNYGRSANNKRQRAIARRDARRAEREKYVSSPEFQDSTNIVNELTSPVAPAQTPNFEMAPSAPQVSRSPEQLQAIYDARQKSDAQFSPLAVIESIKQQQGQQEEQQRQQGLTAELARQNEIAKVKNKKAMDQELEGTDSWWGRRRKDFTNVTGAIEQRVFGSSGASEAQAMTNKAAYEGELESQKNASGFIEQGLEFTRGLGVGAGQGVTGLANVGAGAVDLAGRQVGVDVGANAAVTSVQNAAFGSQESLKSSSSQFGSFVGRTGAGALQAGVGLAPQAAATATATAFGTQAVTDIGLTALNDSGALGNFSEGQRAGVGMLASALVGRKAKKLAPNSINNQSLTGSIARGAMSRAGKITDAAVSGAGNLKDAAVSRAGKVKDSILGPKPLTRAEANTRTINPQLTAQPHKRAALAGQYSQPKVELQKKPGITPPEEKIRTKPKTSFYADRAKNNINSGRLSDRNKFINQQPPTTVSPGGVLPRGVNSTAPETPRGTSLSGSPSNKPAIAPPEFSNLNLKKSKGQDIHELNAEVVQKGHVDVEYHARGGRAGARARAAQRRQNRMQSEQEFPSMAQVGPQNVHRDLAGTPVTRSVMNNPQNFAQASNARSRKAAMRGVPGYLGEMAAMGQMIHVGADSEESKTRTKYSSSGANQFAEGAERQAMLKDIADARQRDKDKYSPERMKSLYGEKNATPAANYKRPPGKGWNWDPTAKKFVNENPQSTTTTPKPPASNMGATAPKPKYDGYTNREYSKSNKPLTAVEKAMQAVRPGWRSANFANGGAVHLARGGRVGGYSGGGKIRRYQDGGNVDPYAESGGGGGGGEAPQMPDMSGFAKSIESLTAFVGSFDGFTKTMAGLASQLSSVTVTHNVTFGGQVNVGGVSGEGIVNAMKSTIEGWVKDQISKHPDVKKAVESSDQTRKG